MSAQVQTSSEEPRTRRERQREATYAEITRASRELLAEGAELSLRAVANRARRRPAPSRTDPRRPPSAGLGDC